MKRIILLFIAFVLTVSFIKSQNYIPFPTTNANWNTYFIYNCSSSAVPFDTSILSYEVMGDTIINLELYKKIYKEKFSAYNPSSKKVIGAIRELNKKIFYIGETYFGLHATTEVLLYDFNAQIGDTIQHDIYFYSIVLDIDSILINGKYRKRYEVDNNWLYHNPDFIVEGIGSLKNSLFGHISDIPTCGTSYWEHICFTHNDSLIYINPTFDDCFPIDTILLSINIKNNNDQINIYPVPFCSEINISNIYNNDIVNVEITDLTNRIVYKEELRDNHINLTINKGTYILILRNSNEEIILKRKILKQ